jgi:hypothetical protein
MWLHFMLDTYKNIRPLLQDFLHFSTITETTLGASLGSQAIVVASSSFKERWGWWTGITGCLLQGLENVYSMQDYLHIGQI